MYLGIHLEFRLLPIFAGCDLTSFFPLSFSDIMSFAFKPKRGGSHRGGGGNFRGHGGPRGKTFGRFWLFLATFLKSGRGDRYQFIFEYGKLVQT